MDSESLVPGGGLDGVADDFAQVRPRLFGIAYRMLGAVADAEDIVQDVWVKWQAARGSTSPPSGRTPSTRLTSGGCCRRSSSLRRRATSTSSNRCSRRMSPSYADGGGVRGASRIPVFGRTRVAKYVAAFATRFWAGVRVDWVHANGRPSVLITRDDAPVAWLTVSGTGTGIDRIYWVMNPPKLERIAATVAAGGSPGPETS